MHWISDKRFFSRSSTKDALESLADCDRLVVYCGAGVTIDQTGLGWEAMLATAFGIDVHRIEGLQRWESFPQIASALAQDAAPDWRREVGLRLGEHLYGKRKVFWSGDLVDRLALLLSAAAAAGRHVTVVTTNYDDFIQTRLRKNLRQARRDARAAARPHLDVMVRVHDGTPRAPLQHVPGRIDVVHLHGRVLRMPRPGSEAEYLVLTEPDYTRSRLNSGDFLARLLSEDVGLLIVGSGLNDQPLIDGLYRTRSTFARRFALWALEPTDMHLSDRCSEYLEFLRLRAEHVGLTLLTPDFLFQMPQFCLELARAISAEEGPRQYVSGPSRYGARLTSWWERSQGARDFAPDPLYRRVARRKTLVVALLGDPPPDGEEEFRLDLWLRTDPAARRDLTLFASSVGPMMEESAYKSRLLGLGSGHATITGFSRGRPVVIGREELGTPFDTTSRWKTFLVVPVSAVVAGIKTPVGAATLCSTSHKASSSLTRVPPLRTSGASSTFCRTSCLTPAADQAGRRLAAEPTTAVTSAASRASSRLLDSWAARLASVFVTGLADGPTGAMPLLHCQPIKQQPRAVAPEGCKTAVFSRPGRSLRATTV